MKRVISLVLVLVMLLSIPISAAESTASATAGEAMTNLAFSDDFNTGTEYDTQKWQKHSNPSASMSIINQKLQLKNTSNEGPHACTISSVKGCQFGDAIYEFDISNIAGSWGALLANRTDIAHRWDDSGYFLTITPTGTCDLYTCYNTKYTKHGTAKISNYDNAQGVSMKLIQDAGTATVFANGTQLFSAKLPESALKSGYAGFTTTGKNSNAELDNIKIYTVPSTPGKEITVAFNANGGICEMQSKTTMSGTTVGELPVATKDGFFFDGWYLDNETFKNQLTPSSVIEQNTTVYANYIEVSSTLNLARLPGNVYTDSSHYSEDYAAAKAFDGGYTDNLSRWAGKTVEDQWIQVEFQKELTFNRVDIYDHKSQTYGEYQLEYSADGQNWTSLRTGGKMRLDGQKMLFEPVNAKFLRLNLRGNSHGPSIFEIEVYNDTTGRYPKSMKMVSLPNKTTYALGEPLDLTGGMVELFYNGGIGQLLPLTNENIEVAGFNANRHARQILKVEYPPAYCEFEVLVLDSNAVGLVTATPEGGNHNVETLEVALSCETVGAAIFYTIDGTEPTKQSIAYNAPITLTKATTIKAIAYLEGKTPSVVETFVYRLNRIEQHQAPFVLHPEDQIDNLECLSAGSAARNKEIGQFMAGPVKYFWLKDFGKRTNDYLKWEIRSDLAEAADYRGWLAINAPQNSQFKLTVSQNEAQTEYTITKSAGGWEVVDCGVFSIPSGVSTLTLKKIGGTAFCQVKTFNIIRESDRAAYEQRIVDFRAASGETLNRLRNAPYGVFYQLGNWGSPSKGPRKGDMNDRANRFDAESFVALQKHMGASYVVWSTSWWSYEPWQDVDALNQIMGSTKFTAERNLTEEVAAACKAQGMDFFLYYHAGVHGGQTPDWEAVNQFPADHNQYGTGDKTIFEDNWVKVISELGEKLGTNLDGWYFDDGCNYFPANFEKLTAATRVGNPARIVSFNAWTGPKVTEFQNTIFGEGNWGNADAPMVDGIYTGGKEEGLLQVAMHTLGKDWGIHGKNQGTQFITTPQALINYTKANNKAKIVSMWGIEMYEDGIINPNVYNAMMALKKAIYPDIVEPATYAVTGLELVANPAGAGNQVANYAMTASGTLQMYATVRPQYATNKAVTWSVLGENGGETTLATVSDGGLLTAGAGNGRFRVRAVSAEKGTIVAEELITITGGTAATYAATPTFSLESGRVTEEKTVSITCATEGAEIHYTLDGNRPTKDSPVYAAPLTINQTMRLKAVAIADGMYNSETAVTSYVWSGTSTGSHTHSWTYAADGATITATCGNADGNHGAPTTATLTVVKPAHTTYGDSKNAAATITGSIDGVSNPAIEYYNGSTKLDAAPTDAGTYQARITVDADKTAYVEYTIAPAAASVTTVPVAKTLTYTGSAQALVIAGTASGGTMQYSLTGTDGTWSAAIPEGTAAGDFTVYYKVVGDTNHSDTASASITVTIAKKSVTAPVISSKTYTGEMLTAEVTAPTEYTVTTNDGGTNAGNYNVVLTLSDAANYKWSDSDTATKTITFTITKGTWTSISATGAAQYGTSGEVNLTSKIAPGGTLGSATVTAGDAYVSPTPTAADNKLSFTFVNNAENQGQTVTVTIPVTNATNYADYTITVTLTISNKSAQSEFDFASAPAAKTYGDEPFTVTTAGAIGAVSYASGTPSVATIDATSGLVTIVSAGMTKITATAAETDGYVAAIANYTLTVSPKSVTAPTADATGFTYTGTAQTYALAAGDGYTVSDNKTQTSAGSYTVTATLESITNYKWSDDTTAAKDYTFTIAKAPLTITADNKSIKVGDPEPTYTATTTGLVNGEIIDDVTFTDTAADTATKGSFTITPAEGTVSGGNANYEISYATGTLTINIDVTVIDTAIAAASVAKTGVTVNEGEPSAVASGTKFVKQTVLDALNSAIQTATDAKLTVNTGTEAQAAATALDNAVVTFTAAIKTGTYVAPSGNNPPPRPVKPEIDAPKTDAETGNTNVVITVKPETKGDTSTATVSDKTVTDAIGSAVKEAEKTGGTSSVEIEITAPEGAKTVETTLSGKSLAAVAEGKTQGLKIATPVAELSFDSQALKNIAEMAGKDVKISAAEVDSKSLTQAQQSQVGNAPIFDFTITSGGDTISNFNGGTATVSVPYTLKDGEDSKFVTVWLLDDAGKLIPIDAQYADGQITFTTGHFSLYVIGYLPFSDVKADWAYESIVYAYNNHLFGGVGDNQFAPADNMSRAMVWTVLYRLAGNPAKTDAALWYADAQAWTVAENISDGTNANGDVTREQLVTILYRYAKGTPVVADMTKFADAAEIADYAEDAVAWAVANNILQGNAGNLNPQGDATRAQVAAMLQRFAVRNK